MNKFFEIVLKKVKTKALIKIFLFVLTLFLFLILTGCQCECEYKYIYASENKTYIIDNNQTINCCFEECFIN